MAKITYHPAVAHMHGGMGHMVFKQSRGLDIVAAKPDQVNQPNTPAQRKRSQECPGCLAQELTTGKGFSWTGGRRRA